MYNNNKNPSGGNSYLYEEIIQRKAEEFISILQEKGIQSEIIMIREYMAKVAIKKDNIDYGNLIIDYKPTKNTFSIRFQELKDKSIEGILFAIWETMTIASKDVHTTSGNDDKDNLNKSKIEFMDASSGKEKLNNFDSKENIEIYVDGSFANKVVGYGAVILKNGKVIEELSGIVEDADYLSSRQVGGEIFAVMKALEWCKEKNIKEVMIYYDFENLEKWVNGKYMTNIPMTRNYAEYVRNCGIKIKWLKVTGHTGVKYNERADKLAKGIINPKMNQSITEEDTAELKKVKNSKKLNKQGLTEEEFLLSYDASKFDRPSVTADILVFSVAACGCKKENDEEGCENRLKLLMIKRGDHPCIGLWALPGGFVNIDENLDDAALRELQEETNVSNIYIEQLYTWGDVGRDPRTRIITVSYMSLIGKPLLCAKAGDDADEAVWMDVSLIKLETTKIQCEDKTVQVFETQYKLILSNKTIDENKKTCSSENGDMSADLKKIITIKEKVSSVRWEIAASNGIAFDHAKIIAYGIEKLREKILHTNIAINVMPELFTLGELKRTYEAILDSKLKENEFEKILTKLSDVLIETNEYKSQKKHKNMEAYDTDNHDNYYYEDKDTRLYKFKQYFD